MKSLFLFILLSFSTQAISQEYRRLSIGLGTGYLVAGTLQKGGLIYFEPAYRLMSKVSFGLRIELATGDLSGTWNKTFMNSYALQGQYYFLQGPVQLFAGLGAGFYSGSISGSLCDCEVEMKQNVPGFYPKVGLYFGHLAFSLEYNFLQDVRMTTTSRIPGLVPTPDVRYIKTNYLATKVGFLVGGGKRK